MGVEGAYILKTFDLQASGTEFFRFECRNISSLYTRHAKRWQSVLQKALCAACMRVRALKCVWRACVRTRGCVRKGVTVHIKTTCGVCVKVRLCASVYAQLRAYIQCVAHTMFMCMYIVYSLTIVSRYPTNRMTSP